MTIFEQLILPSVPEAELPIIDLFRHFIGDTVELNDLHEVQENTDLELYRCLLLALDEMNNLLPAFTNFETLVSSPSVDLLMRGGLLKVLTRKGVISARNTLTYNDAGGISVQNHDTYGRYVNYFNTLISHWYNGLRQMNMKENINSCYGGVDSEYGLYSSDQSYWE